MSDSTLFSPILEGLIPASRVCPILLLLYSFTEHLKRKYTSPQPFTDFTFLQRKYVYINCFQLLCLRFLSYTYFNLLT
jgi:hypothetical protein